MPDNTPSAAAQVTEADLHFLQACITAGLISKIVLKQASDAPPMYSVTCHGSMGSHTREARSLAVAGSRLAWFLQEETRQMVQQFVTPF